MAGELVITQNNRSRYELAKVPGIAEALTPAERQIFKAQFQRTIADYDKAELLAVLRSIIPNVSIDVGCRIPADELAYTCTRASEILRRYYGMLTIPEFRAAFEMCAIGELDKYLPKRDGRADRAHYQLFNTEYICKVLNAYRLKRAEVNRKTEDLRPKEAPGRDPEAEARSWKVVRDGFIHDYLYYKYHLRMPPISPVAIVIYYKTLSRLGWVREMEVTPKEQEAVIYGAVAGVVGRGYRENPVTAYKRKEVERAFREMAEDEVQFNQFI